MIETHVDSMPVTTVAVTDLDQATPFYRDQLVDFIAQIGLARGAWFSDPDGNVFGVRRGPVPAAK